MVFFKFKKHNGIQTQFRLLLWAENFHQEAEIYSVKNISSNAKSIWWYDDTSLLTTCPIQSLLTGLWGLLLVLKPSPCLNVSFGFILLAIFNYCLSPHQPKHLLSVPKETQQTIPWCLCQSILKRSKYLIEQIQLYKMLQLFYDLKTLSQYCAKPILIIFLWGRVAKDGSPGTVVESLKLFFEILELISSLYNWSSILFLPNVFS